MLSYAFGESNYLIFEALISTILLQETKYEFGEAKYELGEAVYELGEGIYLMK